ncbi:MAG: hypothetical protein ACOCQD_00045 [archaeon]
MTIANKNNIKVASFVVDDTAEDTAVSIPSYLPSIQAILGAHEIQLSEDTPNVFDWQELSVVTDSDDISANEISQVNKRQIRIGNDHDAGDDGQEALVVLCYTTK